MTEAVKGAIQFAFDKLGARRIEIRTDATNINACSLAERLEFILEGTMENDFLAPDGSLRDARVYAKSIKKHSPLASVYFVVVNIVLQTSSSHHEYEDLS